MPEILVIKVALPTRDVSYKVPFEVVKERSHTFANVFYQVEGNVWKLDTNKFFCSGLSEIIRRYALWTRDHDVVKLSGDPDFSIVTFFEMYEFADLTGTLEWRKEIIDEYCRVINQRDFRIPMPQIEDIKYLYQRRADNEAKDEVLKETRASIANARFQLSSAKRSGHLYIAKNLEQNIIPVYINRINTIVNRQACMYHLLVTHYIQRRLYADMPCHFYGNEDYPDGFVRELAGHQMRMIQLTMKEFPLVKASEAYDDKIREYMKKERLENRDMVRGKDIFPI